MKMHRRGILVLGIGAILLPLLPALGACAGHEGNGGVRVIAAAGPIELKAVPVRIGLEAANETLPALLSRLGPGQSLHLVLRDLRTAEQPGVLYHVYLDLPAGSRPGADDPHYAGSLNFYNAATSGGFGAPANARFQSFDVTEVARGLRSRGLLSERTTVTIVAGGAPVGAAKPEIGRVELAVQ